MTQRDYFSQKLKALAWLKAFRNQHPEFTFQFASRRPIDLFQGANNDRESYFYVEVVKRTGHNSRCCFNFSFKLNAESKKITQVILGLAWVDDIGNVNEKCQELSRRIFGDPGNQKSKTNTFGGSTEEEVRSSFFTWLGANCQTIKDTLGDAILSSEDFDNNLNTEVQLLVDSDIIRADEVNGVYQLTDTAFQDDNHMDNANNNSNNEGERGSVMKEQIEQLVQLVKSNFQVILTGAPGTGKTFMARKVAEELVCEGIANDNETEKGNAKRNRIGSVQFHPGYDYSDFVIGMKPVLVSGEGKEVFRAENGTLYTTDNGKKDGTRTEFSGKTDVSFQWKSGVFKDFANTAKGDLDHKYVFIIDEINRADLSRVFGEMFSLLEEDYRYCRDGGSAAGVLLPNGENFDIPKNLYIIGTMNDIDRSVESMDFALRRRFAWYEVAADESKAIIDAKVADQESREKLKNAMDALNEKIASADFRLGSEYQLGGAIFAKYAKYIDDDDNNGGGSFDKLWKRHIEIILKEYLRGRRTKEGDLNDLKSIYYGKVRQSSLAAGSATTNSSESPSSTGADD